MRNAFDKVLCAALVLLAVFCLVSCSPDPEKDNGKNTGKENDHAVTTVSDPDSGKDKGTSFTGDISDVITITDEGGIELPDLPID